LEDAPWCSASDLSEYAYCPRAHWYRHHGSPAGIDAHSRRSQELGISYHERSLSALEEREGHVGRWVAIVVLAVAMLVVALYLGGIGF
jgi:CRISPR/Cas system-associated exonuclease Cas4 (RecB family)